MSSLGERLRRRARERTSTSHLRRVEDRYALELRTLMRNLTTQYLEAFYDAASTFRKDSWYEGFIAIIALGFSALVARLVGRAFDKMARGVVGNIAPSELGISEAIAEARAFNISLIDKAGRGYADAVREVLSDADIGSLRVETISQRLQERADISVRHANLIARDQVLKLNANITRIRMQNAGITKYVWNTSHDERVRPKHAAQDGLTFSWEEGTPIGYHPGEDYQCRCVAIAVLEDDED